jgi:hypothetical protein
MEVAGDEGDFLGACPVFDLAFAAEGGCPGGCFAAMMGGEASWEVGT